MLDAASRIFLLILLRNRVKHQHKDQVQDWKEDTKYLRPEIPVSNFSTSTIITEQNINSNPLAAPPPQNHNTDGFAITLNCLKQKLERYNLHKFFVKIYTGKSYPKGTRNFACSAASKY